MSTKKKTNHSGLRDLSRESDEVAKYYDEWAEEYNETLAQWRYQAPEQVAARLRTVLAPDSFILDAGCGTGLSGKALTEAGFKTIDGMDVSQRSLEVAKKLGVYRSLERVDMQKLPLPCDDDCYDGLVCVGVLTYLPDSSGTLREFCRIVKSGGAMVLTQRGDIFEERDFSTVLKELENQGFLGGVRVSDPEPYLPENEEFANEILVRYITCHVR